MSIFRTGEYKLMADFVKWLNDKSHWVRIPETLVDEYEAYLKYISSQERPKPEIEKGQQYG